MPVVYFRPGSIAYIKQEIKNFAEKIHLIDEVINELELIVTELLTNVEKYTVLQQAKIEFSKWKVDGIQIEISDFGEGIDNLEEMMRDGYSTTNSLGIGLGTIKRLSDHLEIDTVKQNNNLKYGSVIKVYKSNTVKKQTRIFDITRQNWTWNVFSHTSQTYSEIKSIIVWNESERLIKCIGIEGIISEQTYTIERDIKHRFHVDLSLDQQILENTVPDNCNYMFLCIDKENGQIQYYSNSTRELTIYIPVLDKFIGLTSGEELTMQFECVIIGLSKAFSPTWKQNKNINFDKSLSRTISELTTTYVRSRISYYVFIIKSLIK